MPAAERGDADDKDGGRRAVQVDPSGVVVPAAGSSGLVRVPGRGAEQLVVLTVRLDSGGAIEQCGEYGHGRRNRRRTHGEVHKRVEGDCEECGEPAGEEPAGVGVPADDKPAQDPDVEKRHGDEQDGEAGEPGFGEDVCVLVVRAFGHGVGGQGAVVRVDGEERAGPGSERGKGGADAAGVGAHAPAPVVGRFLEHLAQGREPVDHRLPAEVGDPAEDDEDGGGDVERPCPDEPGHPEREREPGEGEEERDDAAAREGPEHRGAHDGYGEPDEEVLMRAASRVAPDVLPPAAAGPGGPRPARDEEPKPGKETEAGIGGELVPGDEGPAAPEAAVSRCPPPVKVRRARQALDDREERDGEAEGHDRPGDQCDLFVAADVAGDGDEERDVGREADERVAGGVRIEGRRDGAAGLAGRGRRLPDQRDGCRADRFEEPGRPLDVLEDDQGEGQAGGHEHQGEEAWNGPRDERPDDGRRESRVG